MVNFSQTGVVPPHETDAPPGLFSGDGNVIFPVLWNFQRELPGGDVLPGIQRRRSLPLDVFTDTAPEALTTATSKASPASRDRVCPSVVLRTVYSIKNWLSFPVRRLPLKVGAEHPERNSVRVKAARAPR